MNKVVPWKEIKEEYESIGTSAQVLGLKFNVSNTHVYAHIKAEGWKRAQADEDTGEILDEEDIPEDIQEDAEFLAEINRLIHEAALFEAKKAVHRLLRELDRKTPQIGEIDALLKEGTDVAKRKVLRFVMSFPSRCNAAKALASAIKTLAEIEMMAEGLAAVRKRTGKKQGLQNQADSMTGKFDTPRIDVQKIAA